MMLINHNEYSAHKTEHFTAYHMKFNLNSLKLKNDS